jgi:hypothetical protein
VVERSRAMAERHEDVSALAWTHHHLAVAAAFRGDLPEAAARYEEAIRGLRTVGDLGGAIECTYKLALVVGFMGDDDRAAALCRECEAATTSYGESWFRGLTLFARSLLSWHRAITVASTRRPGRPSV